jgi:hypothetical protein
LGRDGRFPAEVQAIEISKPEHESAGRRAETGIYHPIEGKCSACEYRGEFRHLRDAPKKALAD